MTITSDLAGPGQGSEAFIDCSDGRGQRDTSLGCGLAHWMDEKLTKLLSRMEANREYAFTDCSECRKWHECRKEEGFAANCGPQA